MIIDKDSSIDYRDWIEVSHDGDREVSRRLMAALNKTKVEDPRSIYFDDAEGLYVTSVSFDDKTNTFTFTMSDGTTVVAKVTVSGVDLSDYATKSELDSKVDKVTGKVLSSNDYTTEVKLSGLSNYDDTELKSLLNSKSDKSDTYTKAEVDNQLSTFSSGLSWKPSVPTFSDIATTYPKPKDGWTVSTDDTDVTYRYTGKEWIAISANSIPLATSSVDGKMSSSDKVKLDSLNNYDDTEIRALVGSKADISNVYTKTEVDSKVDKKVDSVSGKGLSSNDFTDKDKSELSKLRVDIDYEGSRALEAEGNINKELERKVSWDEQKKIVVLPKGGKLSGTISEGNGAVLAQINDWGVVDLGSSKLPLTLNSDSRPKVQLPGVSGEDAEEIAYLSDIPSSYTKTEVDELVKDSVKYQDFVYDGQSRKTIKLPNYDSISSVTTTGTGVNIAMVNKWDVVDLGSPNLPINLNTPKGVRPTAQEPGQSGEEANKIAYLSDLDNYVAKEDGKSLSSNDFTDFYIEQINNSTKLTDAPTEELPNRKVLTLNNGDMVLGRTVKGSSVNLAMVNRWNVADYGSNTVHFNINSEDRPTVQLPGQTGDTAEKVAFLSDISGTADSYTKSEIDTKLVQKANLSDIPSKLPNPEPLTIIYNGEVKGLYDGSSSKDVDITITADNLVGLSQKIEEATSNKVDKESGKGLSTNDFTNKDKSELAKLRTDVDYVGGRIEEDLTNTSAALATKVDWDSEKKVISLPKDGSISALRDPSTLEGGVLLAQRTYDNEVTFVTEVGTTKNKLTFNASERPQIDLKGGSSEKMAYESDLKLISKSINIPLRTLEDRIYTQDEILEWFGVEDIISLKNVIVYGGIQFLRYGISLQTNPHYYKMSVEYAAFESSDQIKLVSIGLDTSNDNPVRYTIIINLDGSIVNENSNIGVTMDEFITKTSYDSLEARVAALEAKSN